MTAEPLFLNEQIDSRDDGLCPTKLADGYTGSADNLESTIISFQTNTRLLNENVKKKHDSSAELEFLCESISKFVMENVDEDEETSALTSLDFEIEGCIWKMDLNSQLGAPGLQIHVKLLAKNDNTEDGIIIWVTQTYIVDSQDPDAVLSKIVFKQYPTAKIVLEQTALMVRRAVLRCEFPTFPEGCKDKPFKAVYKLNAKLKTGPNSTICRGTHRASGSVVAVKCVRRSGLPPEEDTAVYDEISILSSLGMKPPHIVPLVDFFEEDDTYFLVKELLTGENVLERISKLGYRYNERIARGVVFNIMEALSYCHDQNIAHRDVNSKNIMFINQDKDRGIKLTGFSYSTRCHAPASMTRQCGTPLFVAPEVLLKKPYGMESDMWSAGCVAFLLLSGNLPFAGATQKDLFRAIVAGKYKFDDNWKDVSEEGKQFVKDLLKVDPNQRLIAEDALDHPWMNVPESELNPRILEDTSLRIRDFHRKMQPVEENQ